MSKEYFKIENCYNYLVVSEDKEVIEELKSVMVDPLTVINWDNFKTGDIYYNEDCEAYNVRASHHMGMIVLEKIS